MSRGFYLFLPPRRITTFRIALILTTLLAVTGTARGQKLEITGQKSLSTNQGEPITLKLSDFTVKGSGENEYPEGFELIVFDGRNYSSSGTTVTPERDFTGKLKVEIRIRRVKAKKVIAQTKKTDIIVDVKAAAAPVNVPPQIIGQTVLRTSVNRPITVALGNLTVVDPDDDYPNGFTLKISAGNNYTVSGATVTPEKDFTGDLKVKTVVNDGQADSKPFDLLVQVVAGDDDPVNEPGEHAPVFTVFSSAPLQYPLGHRNFPVSREIGIEDKDSDELFYAEVYFDPAQYLNGKDELTVDDHPVVQTVFDVKKGLLLLFGRASIPEYQALLKSVRYQFLSDTLPQQNARQIHFRLSDGVRVSEVKTKAVFISESAGLDIPAVFTPNDDQANDLWIIGASRDANSLAAMVRVYDSRGRLIFETSDIENHWDGRFRGEPVPAGTYYYVIEVDTGANAANYKGVVMVLR